MQCFNGHKRNDRKAQIQHQCSIDVYKRQVKLCQDQLGWKRTTTYTVIKRLGERGVLKNDNGTVTSLVSTDEAQELCIRDRDFT